jgi:hypothetical protein
MEIRTFASFSEHLKTIQMFVHPINCEYQQSGSRTHYILYEKMGLTQNETSKKLQRTVGI